MSTQLAPVCPRCAERLTPTVLHHADVTITALRCSACDGHFFSAGDLARIDDIVEPGLIEVRRVPGRRDQRALLDCPACGSADGPMIKIAHARDRNVVTDVCGECQGTWLDGGELEAIQRESLPVFLWNTVRWLADLGREP